MYTYISILTLLGRAAWTKGGYLGQLSSCWLRRKCRLFLAMWINLFLRMTSENFLSAKYNPSARILTRPSTLVQTWSYRRVQRLVRKKHSLLSILSVRKKSWSLFDNLQKKSCPLDPAPTSLVVSCLDVLLPVITRIINCSLTSGEFPDCWKEALVSPLLKKSGVLSEFTNLRPVSNLQYVSKLTERAVFDQTHAHLTSHGLYPPFQSAYRKCHSTETALLKVQNDILMNLDSQRVTLLVLLDLSAAFDTVDHGVNRLSTSFGVRGSALQRFTSYLLNISQHVSFDQNLSAFLKDHAQVHCCSPSMRVSFLRLLRTVYHNRTHTQTILSCIYHSMLTRLVRKTMQLRQWSNAFRLYDRGWSRINYAWMIIRRSSWL